MIVMMMKGSMIIMMIIMMIITYQLRKDILHRIRPVVPLRFLYHENGHLGSTNDVVATTIGYEKYAT